jgi:Flp pilus assembly protein TadG
MPTLRRGKPGERGASIVEFAIAATVFLMSMFAVIEFGRALWVHNALADAARRGARYASLHASANSENVKNVVVYGDPAGGTEPVVTNLSTTNVNVTYSADFEVSGGTVSVNISNYQFPLILPLLVTTIPMPSYTTTLTGESAGRIPSKL